MHSELNPESLEGKNLALNLQHNVARLNITTSSDIRQAAVAFVEAVSELMAYRIAPWPDIASWHPLKDSNGSDLLTQVFGWRDTPEETWWKRPSHKAPDQVSPLVAACRYESEPFWCNHDGLWTQLTNASLQNINLEKFQQRSGIDAAIVVPVHLPFGQIGVVAFTPRDRCIIDLAEDFKNYVDMLALYSRRFITGYVAVTAQARRSATYATLSPREVECLHWAALGKSNEEISIILSLSTSTVRFHITKAAEKLHCVNRAQTILNAARLGYIKAQT